MSHDQTIALSGIADLFEDSFRSLKPTKLGASILAECGERTCEDSMTLQELVELEGVEA